MRTTKVARVTAIGGGLVTVSVLALASTLQSAPTSFAQTRTALAQRFVAALPASFAAETIPVKPKRPMAADSVAATATKPKQEVRQLGTVRVTGVGSLSDRPIDNPMPGYPAELRAAETEGAVIAHFSYDRDGNVDPMSVSIPTSTNNLLSSSVQAALRGWHGTPNTTTQVPFVFVLRDKTGKDLASYPGGMPPGSIVITGDRLSETELRGQAGVLSTAEGPQPVNANQTYFEFQVEKQVSSVPGNPAPRYPDALRAAGVDGEVLAQFVVGTDGRPDMSTFKVLKTNDDLFTTAVLNSLPNMRFSAAQVGGQAVKQLVQMPFQFDPDRP
jgi:TonB family protein